MLELLLLAALIILIAIVYKPLSRMILGALDGHAAKVRAELEQAKRLREEAQMLLAEQQRKLAAGTYRAVVTPVDAAGNRGAAKTIAFKVVKKK